MARQVLCTGPLDPAPISMFEIVVNYKSEYLADKSGRRLRFKFDRQAGQFVRDQDDNLIPDKRGRAFRQWRDHVRSAGRHPIGA